jgi:hypothetical protein
MVHVADPGREFAFMVLAGDRDSTFWRYLIETTGSGTTLTETYQFLWCPVASRLLELPIPRDRQLRRGIQQTIERVKTVTERVPAMP